MLKKILKILFNRFPVWAYGLECRICKMSFSDANDHEEFVDSISGLRVQHVLGI